MLTADHEYVGEAEMARITAQLPAAAPGRWGVFVALVERLKILHFVAGSIVWVAVFGLWQTAQWVRDVDARKAAEVEHKAAIEKEFASVKAAQASDHRDLGDLTSYVERLGLQLDSFGEGQEEMRGILRDLARAQGIPVITAPSPRRHGALHHRSLERTP